MVLNPTIGSGPDGLVLKVSQDAWQGDAQYTVSVDGQQIDGTLMASASHGLGQSDTVTVLGNFSAGTHAVSVNFLNDLYGGTTSTDRNLYVDSVSFKGQTLPNSSAALYGAGARTVASFDEAVPASPSIGSGPDALVLKVSQDDWQGNAQYTVSVDGQQIDGTLTASAEHQFGRDDTVTVHGNFGSGAHSLAVNFLNDLYGGTTSTDRNLYVDGVTFNGAAVPNSTLALYGSGSHSISFGSATPEHDLILG